jgi:hypothetical protein
MSLSLTGTGSNCIDEDFLRDEELFYAQHRKEFCDRLEALVELRNKKDLESRTAGGTKPATTKPMTNDNCNRKSNQNEAAGK